eukprot:tig00000498_g1635.t1
MEATLEQQQMEAQQMQQIPIEQQQMMEQQQMEPQPIGVDVMDQQVVAAVVPMQASQMDKAMMSRPSTGKGGKWYAIRHGRQTGLFQNWDEVRENVYGVPKASFKSFNTREEAENWLKAAPAAATAPTVARASGKRSRNPDGETETTKRWRLALDSIKVTEDEVIIYSDGSCIRNPGPGGYAYLVVFQPLFLGRPGAFEMMARSGCEVSTTNNRMELLGVTTALRQINRHGASVHVFIDSSYIKRGVNDWLKGWKDNGWRTTEGAPIKNKELWEDLDRMMNLHTVQWHWVEPHAGVPGNNLVDGMALRAATTQQQEEANASGEHVLQFVPGRRVRGSLGGIQFMTHSASPPPVLHLGHGDGLPPAAHMPDFGVVNLDNLPPLPPVR